MKLTDAQFDRNLREMFDITARWLMRTHEGHGDRVEQLSRHVDWEQIDRDMDAERERGRTRMRRTRKASSKQG